MQKCTPSADKTPILFQGGEETSPTRWTLRNCCQAQDALRMVRAQREVAPNDGFLQQLCRLNDRLHLAGHFDVKYHPPDEDVE